MRRAADGDQPAPAALVDRGCGALDVVPGQAGERRLVPRLGTVGHLRIRDPLRVHELRDRADRLLRLLGRDTREVDGDPVVVGARTTNLWLAHSQGVPALVDHLY